MRLPHHHRTAKETHKCKLHFKRLSSERSFNFQSHILLIQSHNNNITLICNKNCRRIRLLVNNIVTLWLYRLNKVFFRWNVFLQAGKKRTNRGSNTDHSINTRRKRCINFDLIPAHYFRTFPIWKNYKDFTIYGIKENTKWWSHYISGACSGYWVIWATGYVSTVNMEAQQGAASHCSYHCWWIWHPDWEQPPGHTQVAVSLIPMNSLWWGARLVERGRSFSDSIRNTPR